MVIEFAGKAHLHLKELYLVCYIIQYDLNDQTYSLLLFLTSVFFLAVFDKSHSYFIVGSAKGGL